MGIRIAAAVVAAAFALTACSGEQESESEPVVTTTSAAPATTAPPETEQRHPDVLAASATPGSDGTWRFDVTLSSPYDSPARYADAWRVLTLDGEVLGIRELLHDHANEQPFTRSLSGVAVPDDVTNVIIEGRDLANGWGGSTLEIVLEP